MELLWSNIPQIKAVHRQTSLIYYYCVRQQRANTNTRRKQRTYNENVEGNSAELSLKKEISLCVQIHLFGYTASLD